MLMFIKCLQAADKEHRAIHEISKDRGNNYIQLLDYCDSSEHTLVN